MSTRSAVIAVRLAIEENSVASMTTERKKKETGQPDPAGPDHEDTVSERQTHCV